MSSFPRGSEWRKWDLHLHTPDSRLNQQFGGDWSVYIDALANADFAVYGITNYFCFADGELEKVREGLKARRSLQTVLGNLEFRVDLANKNNEFINVHVLFAEHLSTKQINDAIAHLKLVNTADPAGVQPIYCCDQDIRRAGLDFSKILVNFKELVDHLRLHLGPFDYLVACCPSGYGSFRPTAGDGRGGHLAIEIDKGCHLALGTENDRDFFLKTDRFVGAIQKPVLAGSDAHSISELGRRYCWVKSNPTFDGLRQTLFEPEDRVSLSTSDPRSLYPKPHFSAISARGSIVKGEPLEFDDTSLELNRGLVTVIGGRGAGKSVLLDCLFRHFVDAYRRGDDGRLARIHPESFSVTFTKQGGDEQLIYDHRVEGALTYLHVRQGDIRSLAEDPDALSTEIKRLLGIAQATAQEALGLDLESILEQMADAKRWLHLIDEHGNFVNSTEFNQKIIRTNEERLKAITSKENKELVDRYNTNSAVTSNLSRVQQRLVGLRARLNQFAQDMTRDIASINAALVLYGIKLSDIEVSLHTTEITATEARLAEELRALSEQNAEIQRQLKAQGIEQDAAGLLDKVGVFQKAISESKQKLADIESRQQSLKELSERRRQLSAALIEALQEERRSIERAFSDLKRGRQGWDQTQIALVRRLLSDVTISGEIVFDCAAFYEGLAKVLDGRKFRQAAGASQQERIAARFGVRAFEDFVRLVDGEPSITADDGSLITAEQFANLREFFVPHDEYTMLDYLFLPQWQQRYVRVLALLRYKGKDPDRLSVGQRGTFYVCIKLATDPFGSPFVFDQPEDDLDNEFIVRELVPLFREIKKYRQIIVATHNANLVVNADAEQIVVAANSDECLSYQCGALEEKSIRDLVCTILEGGVEAFLRRESKYSFGAN